MIINSPPQQITGGEISIGSLTLGGASEWCINMFYLQNIACCHIFIFQLRTANLAKIFLGSIYKTWFFIFLSSKNFPNGTHCTKITDILTPDGVSKISDLSGNPLQWIHCLFLKMFWHQNRLVENMHIIIYWVSYSHIAISSKLKIWLPYIKLSCRVVTIFITTLKKCFITILLG